MKRTMTVAALLVAFGVGIDAASAQTTPIAPPKTMGDEGKLPPTERALHPRWAQRIRQPWARKRGWAIRVLCRQQRE